MKQSVYFSLQSSMSLLVLFTTLILLMQMVESFYSTGGLNWLFNFTSTDASIDLAMGSVFVLAWGDCLPTRCYVLDGPLHEE